ncbi:MobF family relaxase [Vibrio mediterranei]|uniref:TrwC relaxase domain-containing protein n=1 Tax=Vibrio mediterranei TaxID=689 RepID=A0ABX5D928_9VIBR|nr:MobF family relaxase [Vibrio mediterranei]PRQ65116.1 hypothetical protein COR51_23635 [Vibrio mediterranei]
MMSISAVSGAGAASSYYEVDDYYTRENSGEHTELSSWEGKGAVLQGLSGPVKPEDFKRVLDGITPDGTELGRVVGGDRQHRAGLDLTFSPPKSVAIMGQVFGDERVIAAHKDAVKETLALVEDLVANARVSTAGVTHRENTKNLTVATFFHTSTRAQDPGMHTHSVIANMTMGDDGKWRSLFSDEIWNNSKAKFGESYSMLLAHKLHELGYDIVAKGKNAEYEIAGVPKALIEHFSTRSRKISELLEERGLSGPKNREWATLQTREDKVTIPKALECAAWLERADEMGVDLRELKANAESASNRTSPDKQFSTARESVRDAMEHLAQRNSQFTSQELVQYVRNLVIGKCTDTVIAEAVGELKDKGVLIEPSKAHEGVLTTRETIATENDNQVRIESGKGQCDAIASRNDAVRVAEQFTLNSGQHRSLEMVATSEDRYMGSQGWAGVGKTHYARALNHLLTDKGMEVIGLSPSAQAANELENSSGIPSNTLASFIFKNSHLIDKEEKGDFWAGIDEKPTQESDRSKFIVVDESSFVSSQDMNKLMKIAEQLDARVLKMGDYKQLGSVDAGSPFEQALNEGIQHETMEEIQRQKDNPELLNAVYAAINGKVSKALQNIGIKENDFCVSEYEKARDTRNDPQPYQVNREEMRLELGRQAAERYLSMSPMERANTALIIPSNQLRTEVNALVRDGLVENGEIDRESIKVTSLKNTGLTNSQMRYAHNYELGQVLRFNTRSEYFGIEKNEYFFVKDNETLLGSDRFLTLVSAKDESKEFVIHPKEIESRGERAVEVFEPSERELAAGDVVRWTRNDKANDVINSQSAIVLSVNEGEHKVSVLLANNETRELDMNDLSNSHLDYNFANTVHAAQGATVDNVITVAESWHKLLTTMRSFYVQISRAKEGVELITDSASDLERTLVQDRGKNDIALSLYHAEDKPLDFDVLRDLKDFLADGSSLKDIYVDLVHAFDGDKFAAQRHLQELGYDIQKVEEHLALGTLDDYQDFDKMDGAAIDDESVELEVDKTQDSDSLDWTSFDDIDGGAIESGKEKDSGLNRDLEMDI